MKIKIIGLILVIMAIVGLTVLSLVNKNKTDQDQTIKMGKIPEIADKPVYRKEYLENYERVSNIWWETERVELPTEAQAIKLKPGFVDIANLRQWAEKMGLEYVEGKWTDGNKKQLSYNPQTKKLEYAENIESKKQLTGNNLPIETIKDNLIKLLAEIEGPKNLPVVITETIPRKLVYPRWVTTTEKEAEVFEIRANYKINGVEVAIDGWESIKSVWTRGGKLIKLVTVWPLETGEKQDIKTKNLAEIQSALNGGGIRIWQVRGGEKTDLSYNTETINRAVNEISLMYVYDEKNSWLMPYYKLVGNAIANNEPVRIEFVAEAGN
ncbi:MAG: hypothetical protein WCV93_00905 [Candidatus Shapirobacteria bacterium]|jgi:hypothetical protein